MQSIHKAGGAVALLAMAALANPALAQSSKWVGAQPGTYSGTNFSVAGDQLTASQTSTAGSLFGSDVLGINGIWIVSTSGGDVSGITATTGGPVGGPAWTAENSPAGFGGHPGYGNAGDWIDLAPTSEILADHGNASPYTSGVFNFTGLSSASNYDIGVDYLLANGNTGRAYFTPTPGKTAVPETPAAGLLVLGLALMAAPVLRARRSRTA